MFSAMCVKNDGSVYSTANLITFITQISKMAKYSGVTTASVWDHFVTAVVPAIQKWQVDGSEKAGSGHLLTQAVEKAHNTDGDMSEVQYIANAQKLLLSPECTTHLSL